MRPNRGLIHGIDTTRPPHNESRHSATRGSPSSSAPSASTSAVFAGGGDVGHIHRITAAVFTQSRENRMNVEPSRPARPSRRTRRSVRHLAVAGLLTISIAACSSGDSDSPKAAGTAAATVPTTVSAGIETPSSTDAPARPAVTQPPNSSAPATSAPPAATEAQVAIALAQRFVEARDASDGEAVRALVADDAVIVDFAVSNADDFLPKVELEQVTGWRYMQPECTAIVPSPPIQVSCTYTMQNAWSEALGVGPFTGSNFTFVIADGQIQQVTHFFDFSEFDPQVYAIFQEWLTATHPNDVGVMYNGGVFSLTPESIALFEHHTTEFAASRNDAGSG
jgi:hypothetical protein